MRKFLVNFSDLIAWGGKRLRKFFKNFPDCLQSSTNDRFLSWKNCHKICIIWTRSTICSISKTDRFRQFSIISKSMKIIGKNMQKMSSCENIRSEFSRKENEENPAHRDLNAVEFEIKIFFFHCCLSLNFHFLLHFSISYVFCDYKI